MPQGWNAPTYPLTPPLACPARANVTGYLPVRRMAASRTYLENHKPEFLILRCTPPNRLNTQINHPGHQKGGFALLKQRPRRQSASAAGQIFQFEDLSSTSE